MIAPWETQSSPGFANARQERASDAGIAPHTKVPPSQRPPPVGLTAPTPNHGWRNGPNGIGGAGNNLFSSFLDDVSSEETGGHLSPAFRPGSSQDEMFRDDRRPSVASATTVSSVGSKSSRGPGYRKKLDNFFGDDFPGVEAVSRQNSESSLPPNVMAMTNFSSNGGPLSATSSRQRQNSANTIQISRPVSPSTFTPQASRPRTPHASEVTPWEFQESGQQPPLPTLPGSAERASISSKVPKPGHHHHFHLPGHRHNRSKEENRPREPIPNIAIRPSTARENSVSSLRRQDLVHSANQSTANLRPSFPTRPPSPTPSYSSAMTTSKLGGHHKRSIFDKIRRKDKDKSNLEGLSNTSGSTVSLTPTKTAQNKRPELVAGPKKFSIAGDALPRLAASTTREAKTRPLFKSKKTETAVPGRDPNQVSNQAGPSNALWHLDTDFSDMSDIINKRPQEKPTMTNEIFAGNEQDERNKRIAQSEDDGANGAWDAPDSWAVKRANDANLARMREIDEGNLPLEETGGAPYCVRIFRADGTFAVLSVPLNSTVHDIICLIRKKSFLQDDIDNYIILMKKHDVSRQLERNERPLVIQKRLLEQAGYAESDRIEDVGREDNSYLCRFTFLPSKSAGYTSLDKDPDMEERHTSKFSHVDLQGKNLVTIPVVLHKKASEIVSLNLSRNLAIDVPKDFIQACGNLREIKFLSNEAWQIPPSFVHAPRLTMLDVSTNRIEQLDHAELDRLTHLASFRASNNLLTSLPSYFSSFRWMRSLILPSNGLTTFPEQIRELTTLVELDVSFNEISTLPDLGPLVSLERFWATNNRLSGSFPPGTANLHRLRECDIRHNALDDIDVFCQLPKLEYLMAGYNHISVFEGTFPTIRGLFINNNPITRFDITSPIPTLTNLFIEKAKLAALPDLLFSKIPNLIKLVLDKNHFVSLSPNIGRLTRLEFLSVAQNSLNSLPPEIGRLVELRYLDLRENNLNVLPAQIWFMKRLETLNLSSNVLGSFPKPGAPLPSLPEESTHFNEALAPMQEEELDRLGDMGFRRPSITHSTTSLSSSPGNQSRKGSVASQFTSSRKPSMVSRGSDATTSTLATLAPITRKDSSLSNRLISTFASSLRHLYLADNRLQDEVFDELALLPELRVLNLSYNILYDLPPRTLRRWTHLDELYLSGNELRSLPAEDLDEVSSLRVLHINCNKFQVLPAELAKVSKLAIMDVGSNALKYNVSNWPYDWNWNWNHQLKYLNMSGNTRLEIKPGGGKAGRSERDLTDFSSLSKLRILGLMDVTLRSTVPDQNEDRRVRTAGSQVGSMSYGMADALGRNEHLSTMDMVVDRFRSHDDEVLVGMFDAPALSMGGSKIAKYLYENFKHRFADELEKLRSDESATDALRRTYLGLNKEVAIAVLQPRDSTTRLPTGAGRSGPHIPNLAEDDLKSGCVGTVLFIKEMQLFVSNVGDITALLVDSDGGHKVITRRHDPTEPSERRRIREAGGYVSRQGKMLDVLDVSRAFGFIQHSPSIIAAPHTAQVTLTDSHEMIIIASRELWQFMSKDFAVDMARTERGDLMRAAQKLRDLAIAFGASGKIMVMVIGVSDLRRKERLQVRTPSMSMSPSGLADEYLPQSRRGRRDKNAPYDSRLARLDQEVDPPVGQVTLVFTDIKNSTMLWETYPIAMRSAIKMHNELMRRQLRIIGGYEVKTEGDAFMVSFPTVTSALLWTFAVQIALLEVQWPNEILSSIHGSEVCDADGNVIFRGLSVRMGIHWGAPVCEVDPVTKRMDYFGPMVNRSSRISSVADGGQITVSAEFIAEVQRLLETHVDSERSGSMDSGEDGSFVDDALAAQIKRELRSLSSQGFEVKELGERRLKGLENPEYIYLMYPHSLSSRLLIQQQRAEAETARGVAAQQATTKAINDGRHYVVDVDHVWDLCAIALRLEDLCSALESATGRDLKAPETSFLESIKEGGGEITDRFLLNIVEHQVSRIEVSQTISIIAS
jgi:adenylate cyclase